MKFLINESVFLQDDEITNKNELNLIRKYWKKFRELTEYNHNLIEKEPDFYSATAGKNPEEQFIVKDRMTTYTSAQRSSIVIQILLRIKYDENAEKVGIRRLLKDGTYLACFPLHEGRWDSPHSSGKIFDRRVNIFF